MNIYVVTREGVYRHEILGAFFSIEEAKRVAEKACTDDTDDYHVYDVNKLVEGATVEDAETKIRVSRSDKDRENMYKKREVPLITIQSF